MVRPFLTNNLVGGVGVHLNLVSGKDQLDIEEIGIYLDSVSSNSWLVSLISNSINSIVK